MKWIRVASGSLLLMAACTGFPFLRAEPASDEALGAGKESHAVKREQGEPRVQLEFQDIHYDGETLSGRLLVGVTEGRLRLNKQLVSDIHAEVRYPVDCHTGLPVKYIIWDSFQPRRQEDLLILEPGYWYGKEIRFPLFEEHLTGVGPECLKAELWLFSFDGRIAARTEIRAERSPRPSDAGSPEAPADAGVPEAPGDDGGVEVHFTGPRAGP